MTATDTEAMSALHELLDERQRYQGWLATLEGRRSSTPPHVYERVQRDYAGRLDRVMQTLAERAGQLTGTIDAMTADLATLRDQESDRTDERNEAELRAAVGEFTPDEWEQRRADVDREIERIAAERRSVEEELHELQRIVALTASIEPMGAASEAVAERPQESQSGGEAAGRPAQRDAAAHTSAQRRRGHRSMTSSPSGIHRKHVRTCRVIRRASSTTISPTRKGWKILLSPRRRWAGIRLVQLARIMESPTV